MRLPFLLALCVTIALTGCSTTTAPASSVDPAIARALDEVKAIDNHAHPVLPTPAGAPPDMGFDALPVENLEPWSDPARFRPGRPEFAQAASAIFGSGNDRAAAAKQWGANYASTVLDKAGIGQMIANRVSMGDGSGLPKERFLWAAYADALMYPFPTEGIAANSDRKAFFALEAKLLAQYKTESGKENQAPTSLDAYLREIVTPTLERHKKGGAIAEKFEMAYLRPLAIGNPSKPDAERAWRTAATNPTDYRILQDFLFRHIALECGRLGMAVHIHTGMGGGSYYDSAGSNPVLLEPLYIDPALRKTNIVMVHGGWPYSQQATALLVKPNAYIDFSAQTLFLPAREVAQGLRSWLEMVPEKVLFATDAYPFAPPANMGWEETAYVSSKNAREALGIALTDMVRDKSVDQARAIEIGKMVLRENARKLYSLP